MLMTCCKKCKKVVVMVDENGHCEDCQRKKPTQLYFPQQTRSIVYTLERTALEELKVFFVEENNESRQHETVE